MNCKTFKECSHAMLDGELPTEQTFFLQAHLEACPSCRDYWRQLREVRSLLSDYPVWKSPTTLEQSIRAIWRPSLRPATPFYLPNLFVSSWPTAFWRYRLAGACSGLTLAFMLFLFFPIQVGRLQMQLEIVMQTRPATVFHSPWSRPSDDPFAFLENHRLNPDSFYNLESDAGTRRFANSTINQFAEYEEEARHEDSFTVLTYISTDGASSIQNVLRNPQDRRLVQRFGTLLSRSKVNTGGVATAYPGIIIWSFQRIIVTG
jgi:hypothetical protein